MSKEDWITMETIRSVNNDRVKQWSKLLMKKGREESGNFLLEGLTSIEEAIRYDGIIETILLLEDDRIETKYHDEIEIITKAFNGKKQLLPDIFKVSEQVLHKLTETITPQGIIAVVKQPKFQIESLSHVHDGLFLMLDGVQDPGNLGTIIRTADATGVKGILLGDGTVDLYNPKVIRSTMGSLFHLPIVKGSLDQIIPVWKKNGMTVVGTRLLESVAHYHYDFPRYVGIIVGNEANGVSESMVRHIDQWVKIPMVGAAESLNVAIASAVILYEAVRQRDMNP